MKRLTKRVLVAFGFCLLMAGSAWADVQTLYVSKLEIPYQNSYAGLVRASGRAVKGKKGIAVPEPAMLGTLLFGLLSAGLFWRKRSI